MIDTLLNDFIQAFNRNSYYSKELQRETFYAAIQGDSERFIRWKFLNHIYHSKSKRKPIDFSLALESFDRNDMIFTCGKEVHFVEWKAMTLPLKNQNSVMRDKKRIDNLLQLFKSFVKLQEENNKHKNSKRSKHKEYYNDIVQNGQARYWSAFVYFRFDPDTGANKLPKFFKAHGIFQKYKGGSYISSAHNLANANSIFGPSSVPHVSITPMPPAAIFQNSIDVFFELNEFTTHIKTINQQHKNKTKKDLNKSDVGKFKSAKECNDKLLKPYGDKDSVKFPSHTSPETSPTNNLTHQKRKRLSQR
jgi:hypothetical protein